MLMFAGTGADVVKGSIWITEIQNGIDRVVNPKAAAALHAARIDTDSLLEAMVLESGGDRAKAN